MKQQTPALIIAAAILGAAMVLSYVAQSVDAQPEPRGAFSLRIDDIFGVESSEEGLSIDILSSLLEPPK
jgi:hypothetical protein